VGAQASGKSSVGRALAERVARGAFIEGYALWKMVVAGAVDMSSESNPEADGQLALRYRHGAMLRESFVREGFVAVHAENMYGVAVQRHLRTLRCDRSIVVLRPRGDRSAAARWPTRSEGGCEDDGRLWLEIGPE